MPKSDQNMTRYLLGELSEQEQAVLEQQYFDDPQVFEQVLRSESELVDRYARGQLSTEAREQFERTYLKHPKRRERVKFAEALVNRVDRNETAWPSEKPAGVPSSWRRLMAFSGRKPILEFSLALASLLLVIGSVWFFLESRRSRQELMQAESARADREARVLELEKQIAAERKRTEELTAQLDRQQQQVPQTEATPTPEPRALPTLATLVLTVGGLRGGDTGKTPTLVIPSGATEARLQLNLKDASYPSYRVSLQAAGGAEIFSRDNLKPRITRSGASFNLIVPAGKFATGDYILTLRGVSQDGEIEDLSKSIFRVEKR